MDKHLIEIYLVELESQSLMAINATGVLNLIGVKMDSNQYVGTNYECFRTIHSFLTHLSNISRLIWPPALSSTQKCFCGKPRANGLTCSICISRARSAQILAALDIQDDAHVIRNRTLRDHLEHFDERIDHWMQTSENKNYIQNYIGPKGGIAGFDESDKMRQYDFVSGEFTFRGETYSLVSLFSGLKDILSRTRAALLKSRGF
ncbi:hypothetical protein [Pseudomonas thivervalensis]|uniref:hypothetical protein n=1 Tax=Pseudomonas thivervalensis TaxID=86265 RepID=UPI003D9A08B9